MQVEKSKFVAPMMQPNCCLTMNVMSVLISETNWGILGAMYYSGARLCNKKVDLKGGMYVCGKCGTHCDKPKLRYKIKLRVYDAKGSAPFLLWDREALELLGGITAEELKAMQPKVTILLFSLASVT
nr:replication factor A protein 1-like [Ipomoea batatas]